MKLEDYLHKHKMTILEFSELIGYSRPHISGIINGKLNASPRLAKHIEIATNGEVKAKSLLIKKAKKKTS